MGSRVTSTKTGTVTSSFGSPGRINHDSSLFYNSRLYDGLITETGKLEKENQIPMEYINKHFCHSSANMYELPDNSIHLMITSPPYNVTKVYDNDLNLTEYLNLLKSIWQETYRVLVPGGRACINIANLGRKPYIPLHSYIINDMNSLGFIMRGEIIWNKASSASPSTAWGTWLSASNPVLRDIHEYVLIFSKHSLTRKKTKKENTISRDEFLEYTKSVWTFPAVSAKKIGHPAPFPEELPSRLIKLYSYANDVILDPFVGSGTTSLSAIKNNRNYIGYDISEEYCKLADARVFLCKEQTEIDM
ncbi:site-specific DNA-methyltransferase [Candidatus Gottesmanbacteria bacterium]|nr:site-specific DNA-methyltransferase [Candidatus Gottesmanbacteria bacterium]